MIQLRLIRFNSRAIAKRLEARWLSLYLRIHG
jgi:hypothetical protein